MMVWIRRLMRGGIIGIASLVVLLSANASAMRAELPQALRRASYSGTLEQAVRAATLAQRPELDGTPMFISPIASVDGWVFGTNGVMPAAPEAQEPQILLFLAEQQTGGWNVALEYTAAFDQALARAPGGLLTSAQRATLEHGATLQGNGSMQLSLPWATGETQYLTGGPHDGVRAALDFSGGSGVVRAAREGTAYRPCGSASPYVRVDHGGGLSTNYYHITNVSVANGQAVGRGTALGQQSALSGTSCLTGSANGSHVHFWIGQNGSSVPINGIDIGGWTVSAGSNEYAGCMTRIRDGLRQCVPAATYPPIPNEGTIGSGTVASKMDINRPGGGETVAGTFIIGGWAIHEAASSGTGVDQVHIYFDGPSGSGARGVAATYGVQRDDVAAAFGDRFRYSGYHLQFSSAELSIGQHTIYVYAHSTANGQWQLMTRTFNVANVPPNIPNLLAPANGAWVGEQSVTLRWQDTGDFDNRPSGARNYSGWIWKSDNSWSREIAWQDPASATIALPGYGTYYWKIQSGDGWVGSGFSATWSFTVNQPPNIPSLLAPANDSALASREVMLQWQPADDPDGGPSATRNYSGWIWKSDNSWNYEIPWQEATSLTLQVPADGSYYWKIQSGDGWVGSGFSAPWTFTVLSSPNAPSNLRQSDASADLLAISWDDNAANEDGFKIYRWDWDGVQWEFLLYDTVSANATTYLDSNLSCASDYYYQVSAFNSRGESARAGWIKASTTACPLPAAPDELSISGATDNSLSLRWLDAARDEQGFNVYKWGWNGMFWDFVYLASVGPNVTSFIDVGLSCEADYYYTVSAYNAVGESSRAGWVKGTTSACPVAEPTATGTAVAPPTGTPTSTPNIPPTATSTATATATVTRTPTPTSTPGGAPSGKQRVFIPYVRR